MLRAYFPGLIETHSLIQDFFFGEDLMLRRHDYSVSWTPKMRQLAKVEPCP